MSDKVEILSPEFYSQFNGMTTKRVRLNDSIVIVLFHCTLNGHSAEVNVSTNEDPEGVCTDEVYQVGAFYDGAKYHKDRIVVKGWESGFRTFSFPEDAFWSLPEVIQDWFTRKFQ